MEKVCTFDGCEYPVTARGLCNAHYQQDRLGVPLTPRKRPYIKHQPKLSDTCTFEGCDRPYFAKNYCSSHYHQDLEGRELRPVRKSYRANRGHAAQCEFPHCTKAREAWGLCIGHLRQEQAGMKLRPLRLSFKRCGVPGCGSSENLMWGMCGKHFSRFRRYGINVVQAGMIDIDNRACDLCERKGLPLNIDHDHSCCPGGQGQYTCGKCIRGFLCSGCNYGLGNFQDDIDRLKKAIEYLETQNG